MPKGCLKRIRKRPKKKNGECEAAPLSGVALVEKPLKRRIVVKGELTKKKGNKMEGLLFLGAALIFGFATIYKE